MTDEHSNTHSSNTVYTAPTASASSALIILLCHENLWSMDDSAIRDTRLPRKVCSPKIWTVASALAILTGLLLGYRYWLTNWGGEECSQYAQGILHFHNPVSSLRKVVFRKHLSHWTSSLSFTSKACLLSHNYWHLSICIWICLWTSRMCTIKHAIHFKFNVIG